MALEFPADHNPVAQRELGVAQMAGRRVSLGLPVLFKPRRLALFFESADQLARFGNRPGPRHAGNSFDVLPLVSAGLGTGLSVFDSRLIATGICRMSLLLCRSGSGRGGLR